uniref:Integrase core domain containing protein n=1 Tax=Solanum tuberosum TaxID=4113 RepID=M1DQP1_SOLTU
MHHLTYRVDPRAVSPSTDRREAYVPIWHYDRFIEARREGKRKRQQFETAKRQSMIDQEMRQQWAREVDVCLSDALSTTEGVLTIDEGATDGIPTTVPVGCGRLYPPVT